MNRVVKVMAYFDKETYDRKREYAYRISKEGLENIALYLVAENTNVVKIQPMKLIKKLKI